MTFNKPCTYAGVKKITLKMPMDTEPWDFGERYYIEQYAKNSKKWCIVHHTIGVTVNINNNNNNIKFKRAETEYLFTGRLREAKKYFLALVEELKKENGTPRKDYMAKLYGEK